jgi:putative isomerase
VLERISRFIRWFEERYTGLHGLMLTHSSLASGFDTDLLTAGLPDRSVEGPDASAFMVLEYRALAELSRRLGRDADAGHWDEKAEHLRDLMERLLWYEDSRGGFYTALRWQHGVGTLEGELIADRDLLGRVVPLESWTTLLPLYAGIPSERRAERMMQRLLDPGAYWSPAGVRTVPADSPYFHQAPRVMLFDFKKDGRGPVSNWTGPVWILSNYYVAQGLARYGREAEARELSLRTARLLARGLSREGGLRECYDDHGRGLWPRKGTFLSWNVLALTLLREHAPDALPAWLKP